MSADEWTSTDIVDAIVLQMTHDARTTSGMVSFDTEHDSEEQLAYKAGHAARFSPRGIQTSEFVYSASGAPDGQLNAAKLGHIETRRLLSMFARAYGLGVADAALIAGIKRKASILEIINYFMDEWKD